MTTPRPTTALLLLAAVSTCTSPPAPEPQLNRPPRIVLATLQPPGVDTDYKPGCPLPFAASVEDWDVEDTIRSRWYVFAPGGAFGLPYSGQSLAASDRALRSEQLTPPEELRTSALYQNGQHHLMLAVADGEFASNGTDTIYRTLQLPDGGTIYDPSYVDAWVWLVNSNDQLTACP